MSERLALLETRLRQALDPLELEIVDDSHRHAGHPGARGGAGHYTVTIVSERFRHRTTVERHRLVYEAVGDMMPDQIHALSIQARVPGEG